jgi:hypothetical protein
MQVPVSTIGLKWLRKTKGCMGSRRETERTHESGEVIPKGNSGHR